jgi:hypothetical protein
MPFQVELLAIIPNSSERSSSCSERMLTAPLSEMVRACDVTLAQSALHFRQAGA